MAFDCGVEERVETPVDELFAGHDVEADLLSQVAHRRLAVVAHKSIGRGSRILPDDYVEDVRSKEDALEEIMGNLKAPRLGDKPRAQADGLINDTGLVNKAVKHQFLGCIEHFSFFNDVLDQIDPVHDRLVDEAFVLDAIDQKVQESIVRLVVLEGFVKPANPFLLHRLRVEHFNN
jgi:hypothetical protein